MNVTDSTNAVHNDSLLQSDCLSHISGSATLPARPPMAPSISAYVRLLASPLSRLIPKLDFRSLWSYHTPRSALDAGPQWHSPLNNHLTPFKSVSLPLRIQLHNCFGRPGTLLSALLLVAMPTNLYPTRCFAAPRRLYTSGASITTANRQSRYLVAYSITKRLSDCPSRSYCVSRYSMPLALRLLVHLRLHHHSAKLMTELPYPMRHDFAAVVTRRLVVPIRPYTLGSLPKFRLWYLYPFAAALRTLNPTATVLDTTLNCTITGTTPS